MYKYIKTSSEFPKHSFCVTIFDPEADIESDIVDRKFYYFDSWEECEDWLKLNDYTDPNMFTDNPEVNKTGIYIEYRVRQDGKNSDSQYIQFLKKLHR